MNPNFGKLVLYTLSDADARAINTSRSKAKFVVPSSTAPFMLPEGNAVKEGDVFPMLVTRTWGIDPGSAVNGQVHLDGNDLHWVTSVLPGVGPRTFTLAG